MSGPSSGVLACLTAHYMTRATPPSETPRTRCQIQPFVCQMAHMHQLTSWKTLVWSVLDVWPLLITKKTVKASRNIQRARLQLLHCLLLMRPLDDAGGNQDLHVFRVFECLSLMLYDLTITCCGWLKKIFNEK